MNFRAGVNEERIMEHWEIIFTQRFAATMWSILELQESERTFLLNFKILKKKKIHKNVLQCVIIQICEALWL